MRPSETTSRGVEVEVPEGHARHAAVRRVVTFKKVIELVVQCTREKLVAEVSVGRASHVHPA